MIAFGGALRLGTIAVMITACLPAKAEPLPPELADFDRSLSFRDPLLVSVIRSYGIQNRFALIPNQLEIKKRSDGSPDMTLYYDPNIPGGYLTLNVKVGLEKERLDTVQDEIRQFEKDAQFSIMEPLLSTFHIGTPGTEAGKAVIREATVIDPNEFALTFTVDELFRRIFLVPSSHLSDFFSIRYEGTYRGVIRDDNGTPKIGTRVYSIGSSYGGACTLHPSVAFNLQTHREGCVYPNYYRGLVRSIQKELKRLKLLKSASDGIYGPETHGAIQRFQSKTKVIPDGLPTDDLLERLKTSVDGCCTT